MTKRIIVDVIDDCDYRRRAVSYRCEKALLQLCSTYAEFSVRDFRSVREWQSNIENVRFDAYVVLLHSRDDNTRSVVKWFEERTAQHPKVRLITYTGGSGEVRFDGLDPKSCSWWEHFAGVKRVADYDNPASAVGVGMVNPPVERILQKILEVRGSVTTEAEQGAIDSPRTQDVDADIRHRLINAVSPIRLAVRLTLEGQDNSDGIQQFWKKFLAEMAKLGDNLPTWITQLTKDLDTRVVSVLTDVGSRESVLSSLYLELGRVENFARQLGEETARLTDVAKGVKERDKEFKAKILWIDDEITWFAALKGLLSEGGFDVEFSTSPQRWLESPKALSNFDAIVLDIILENQGESIRSTLSGLEIETPIEIDDSNAGIGILLAIRHMLSMCPPIYMLTARESVSVIRACTQWGAHGYFLKGRSNFGEFFVGLYNSIQEHRQKKAEAVQPLNDKITVGGTNDPLSDCLAQVARIAESSSRGPVLLIGEPGVGKEELAHEIHERLRRKGYGGTLEIVDCTQLSGDLAQSELFGHVRGAYTGAVRDRWGRIHDAEGGTIFIDEFDKLDGQTQDKLLRFIETRTYSRLGENVVRHSDVMIVLASNRDPKQSLKDCKISQAMFSRVTKFVVWIPGLRRRPVAVEKMVDSLIRRICETEGTVRKQITEDGIRWIKAQSESGLFDGEGGNVRGLRDLIERAIVNNPETDLLDTAHLKKSAFVTTNPENSVPVSAVLHEVGQLLAEYAKSQSKLSLSELEYQVRAELFRLLGREDIQKIFGLTPDNVRQYFQTLRNKGLLPPGV